MLPRYRLLGTTLRILPIPSDVTAGTVLYAPEATVLVTGSDTVTYPNGWERFIVLYAAMRCLAKEEQSVATLGGLLAAIEKEIEETKEKRDLASPKQVTDIDRVDFERWY